MTISLAARAGMLDGFEDFMESGAGTANFTVYQSNTALAVFPLDSIPFNPATLDTLVAGSLPITSAGTEVAGTVNRFVITNQNGETAYSGTIGAVGSGADIEVPSLTITGSLTQTLNSLVFRMAADGSLSVEASLTLQ